MDKTSLSSLIQEFIINIRYSVDSKLKYITSLLNSVREENEQIILKCK